MCQPTSVTDRGSVSDRGGGPSPGTDQTKNQTAKSRTRRDPLRCLACSGQADGDLITVQDTVRRIPNDELKQRVVETSVTIERLHAELACLVAELDDRALPTVDESLSTKAWLRHHTRMTGNDAVATIKTARAIESMPTIIDGALRGAIPHRSVRLLSMAQHRFPDAFTEHEPVFAEIASYLTVRDLKRALSHWEQQVDFDATLDDAERASRLREMYVSQTYEGAWDVRGRLPAAEGHVVSTALRAHVQRSNLDPNDRRTMPQRLADASVDIHQFWLDHNETVPTSGGEKPHVTVTVDYEALTGSKAELPEIDDHPVDPTTIRRWLCDAGVVRIVLDGDSQPIDVGRRTRTIPPALRRAVELRDGGCRWQGCDLPTSWCDVHHIEHWADGGPTSLANCELLCRRHHTAVHQGKPRPPDP